MKSSKTTNPTGLIQKLLASWTGSSASACRRQARHFQFENLEERCVLSANGLEFSPDTPPQDTQFSVNEQTPETESRNDLDVQTNIRSVQVRVNGELVTLNPSDDRLALSVGDEFEVVNIDFDSNANEGVFAVEGYVNKITDNRSASLIDYEDGRFSLIESNYFANGENGSVRGLDGSWKAELGWDRLTLSMIHYQDSGTTIAARAIIQLEVGQPDFSFDESTFENLRQQTGIVGQQFDIFGAWKNSQSGTFHNYAEVDIYHESDKEQIVWAGALVGNASPDNVVEGNFLNTRSDDPFSESFVPETAGSYILRFYLDPEQVVSESDESNNQFDVEIQVEEPNQVPRAVNDQFTTSTNETLAKIDALANDLDGDGDALSVHDFTQPENGEVSLNDDGTFSYRPTKDFSGTDEFSYTVSDGVSTSDPALVQIQVEQPGFAVESKAKGDEDSVIDLSIKVDSDRFTHVRVSNVPDGASLNGGNSVADGSFHVDVAELDGLAITPPANSDASFELTVTPFDGSTAYVNLTETLTVDVNAVVDGGHVDVANFGIVTGASGRLPFRFAFDDLDGSENHTVTFHNLPDFISLSAGEKIGDDWVLRYDDLADLRIESTRVEDISGFSSSRGYYFKRFDARVTAFSAEDASGDSIEHVEEFYFYAFQRK